MKVSMLAKSAAVALVFGLVASTPAHAVDLSGSGASFPTNLIEACKAPFATASGHTYTYASGSSSTGRGNADKAVGDFWFTDAAHTAATKPATIIHIPAVAAPVGVLHNLPSRKELALSASTIAGIFAGTITKWNDPAIVKDNNRTSNKITYKTKNGVVVKDSKGDPIVLKSTPVTLSYTNLPNKTIKVIYRSEGSGTSENFTNYLNKTSPTIWPNVKNATFATSFPGKLTDPANLGRMSSISTSQGVAQLASKTPYSITYAETSFAKSNGLKVASVYNASGNAVLPTAISTSAFLSQAAMDANGIVTFDYETKEKGAYTLGIVSYMLVNTAYADKTRGAAVKSLVQYLISPACAKDKGAALDFAPLDGEFLTKANALVAKIG
jgi:phosphate transport system substrate-binding protein